ncbi:MAG: AI-2E family transporter [Halobacteriaceae archaeon]
MAELPGLPRERAAWWALVGALFLVGALVVFRLLGTAVLGVFLYYGLRPVHRRVESVVPSRTVAAALTFLLVALPMMAVVTFLVAQGLHQATPEIATYRTLLEPYVDVSALVADPVQKLLALVEDPSAGRLRELLTRGATYLGAVVRALQTLFVAVLLAFTLLREDRRVAAWFRDLAGGTESAGWAYATAVDRDLETIYFSNVLLILLVGVAAVVVYRGYNYLAPAPVDVPFPTAMGVLTGFASVVPLVVGKLVYVPLVAYLLVVAASRDGSLVVYPLGLLVAAFLLLDLVPLTFVLPELASRNTHVAPLLFGYVVGTVVFGWYGLFLGPLLVVLGAQAVRVVLPELVHGERVTGSVEDAPDIGADPKSDREE